MLALLDTSEEKVREGIFLLNLKRYYWKMDIKVGKDWWLELQYFNIYCFHMVPKYRTLFQLEINILVTFQVAGTKNHENWNGEY